MRNKLRLETYNSIKLFNRTVEDLNGKIELICPSKGYRVNAKSFLSCVMVLSEWDADDVWVESEEDIYSKIEPWIVIGEDSISIHE